jgi:hypothetical protein
MIEGQNQTDVTIEQLFKIGSGWCAFRNDSNQWIQISREKPVVWQGIKVQGRHDADMWARAIRIESSDDGNEWTPLVPSDHDRYICQESDNCTASEGQLLFDGSKDRDSVRSIMFEALSAYPFVVRSKLLRVRVPKWEGWPCLRLEAYQISP